MRVVFFFFYCLVASSCDEHKEFSFDWHDVLLKQKWSISIQAPTTCFFFRDSSYVAVVLQRWRLNCSFPLNPLMEEVEKSESKWGHFRSLLTSQAWGSSQFLLLWLFCVQPDLPLVHQHSHSGTDDTTLLSSAMVALKWVFTVNTPVIDLVPQRELVWRKDVIQPEPECEASSLSSPCAHCQMWNLFEVSCSLNELLFGLWLV